MIFDLNFPELIQMNNYEVKVTKINNRFHARLVYLGKCIDEMACELRIDIGYISRYMIRMEDKSGGDKFTSASRLRMNTNPDNFGYPKGKVWHSSRIQKEQE